MKFAHKLTLALAVFLLTAQLLSLTIKTAQAKDTTKAEDSMVVSSSASARALVYLMKIDGAIGTVTDTRVSGAIELADENKAELLLIELDTPGGFTKPTWSICKSFLNSPVPICIYIAPSGARAGSAGVYMTYAAHIAAMAHSTNIGAAHPVAGGGEEIDSVMNEKITNDAVAQIKAAAQKRGRNAEWAEKAVRESVSIPDSEALALNVIDVRAKNIDDLFTQIDGREVDLPQGKKKLSLKDPIVEEIEISLVHKILDIITQPDVAFILMSIGGLGIILELYNPGSIFPGVVGAISLILAFYSFQTLPINYAGLALIILAAILFIAEIKVVSHGLLTIGGIISLFFGGLMLIDTVDPSLKISKSVLASVALFTGVVVFLVFRLVYKASKHQPFTGNEGMIGRIGEVRSGGFIYVEGALWKAQSDEPLDIGSKVEIVGADNLLLKVKKLK
ncbi:MAG TPA: nodulation protein NfeD [candidate division Zixibacteria bacterium]|nr:nodulation protein NfeD [candidate division Zixibacteria bacterium]